MKLVPEKNVKIAVICSDCDLMRPGDAVYLNGPVLDREKSGPVCVTALLSLYPWVMGVRFGIESDLLGWNNGYTICCPDKLVDFRITFLDIEDDEEE